MRYALSHRNSIKFPILGVLQMKKSLLAAAVLSAVSFGAYADGVELYGLVDIAVANESAAYSSSSTFPSGLAIKGGVTATQTQSLTSMVSGGLSGSRWGIKGSED
jgi:predicted porin